MGWCGRIALSARRTGSAEPVTGPGGLPLLVSMVTASGHGVCAAAIFPATMGSASEALPVLLRIRHAVTSAGAVQRSWTKSAAAWPAVVCAAARWPEEIHEASAITDSPRESSSAARCSSSW